LSAARWRCRLRNACALRFNMLQSISGVKLTDAPANVLSRRHKSDGSTGGADLFDDSSQRRSASLLRRARTRRSQRWSVRRTNTGKRFWSALPTQQDAA